jgi:hypothetical protein
MKKPSNGKDHAPDHAPDKKQAPSPLEQALGPGLGYLAQSRWPMAPDPPPTPSKQFDESPEELAAWKKYRERLRKLAGFDKP